MTTNSSPTRTPTQLAADNAPTWLALLLGGLGAANPGGQPTAVQVAAILAAAAYLIANHITTRATQTLNTPTPDDARMDALEGNQNLLELGVHGVRQAHAELASELEEVRDHLAGLDGTTQLHADQIDRANAQGQRLSEAIGTKATWRQVQDMSSGIGQRLDENDQRVGTVSDRLNNHDQATADLAARTADLERTAAAHADRLTAHSQALDDATGGEGHPPDPTGQTNTADRLATVAGEVDRITSGDPSVILEPGAPRTADQLEGGGGHGDQGEPGPAGAVPAHETPPAAPGTAPYTWGAPVTHGFEVPAHLVTFPDDPSEVGDQ